MVKLLQSFEYEIDPIPPYNFDLTVRKPAGWPLFTPFEVYEKGTIWTATHLHGALVGIKLMSMGTTEEPMIDARLFLKSELKPEQLSKIKLSLVHDLNANGNLAEFYKIAQSDSVLELVVEDLYGMHSTSSSTIFPDALLAILLQMTTFKRSDGMMSCLITKYGEVAQFDGQNVRVWPLPKAIVRHDAPELAKACNLGYRGKFIANLAKKLERENFPTTEDLEKLTSEEAKRRLLELPGIGDYSADIINPHGGFPIDAWSVDIFGKLFYGEEPEDRRKAINGIKKEGLRRWGKWSWMAFFYVVQGLDNLSRKMKIELRRE